MHKIAFTYLLNDLSVRKRPNLGYRRSRLDPGCQAAGLMYRLTVLAGDLISALRGKLPGAGSAWCKRPLRASPTTGPRIPAARF